MPGVALFVTCVVDVLAPEVGDAAVALLRAAGHTVTFDPDQTCCGQPAWNAGHARPAADVARASLVALERELADGADVVVVPAGSCAAMIRIGWGELFRAVGDEPTAQRAERVAARTRELTEAVAEMGPPPLALPTPTRVAVHQSCHLLRELRVRPDAVLGAVDGCELVAWPDGERCCGFGGLFSVTLPEVSEAMADEKLRSLPDCDVVVSADQSCLVHLRGRAESTGRAPRTRFAHVAELLAEATDAP
ncbi:MAG: (Fe-S)-binding protein [Acidimicrobiia bacterium]|nr:(Fe-S)-binding protein [Acidimicrobiia bacterium]